MPQDLSYLWPSYTIVSAIGIVLCLFPVPAHWRAGNIATVSLAGWIVIGLLMSAINVGVWHGNIRNPYPIWGDIVQQYYVMLPVAIASCLLCIQYRLWSIARAKTVFITKREKTRQKWATYFFCFGIPGILCALHYVVHGHRYNVIEDFGPTASTYNVTLAYPLYLMWEPLLCVISAIFSALTIRLFLARRKEFDAVLDSGSNNINKDRYLRLLSLAAISICIHLPLALWLVFLNTIVYEVQPWISWEDTHSNWMRIMYVTRFAMQTAPQQAVYMSLTIWPLPLSAFTYFLFFGFGEEASKQYQTIIGAMLRPFGITYPKEKKRQTIKRTWLDVLLCRPGRPINLTSSVPTSSIPTFATNPSEHPSRNKPSTRSGATSSGGNDLNLDISNLDFLDQAEARKQARISAYTRPGQAAKKNGPSKRPRASLDSSIHRFSMDESDKDGSDITDEKRANTDDDDVSSPSTSTVPAKTEVDLEAQEQQTYDQVVQQRRKEILEKNPDLTEEVTF